MVQPKKYDHFNFGVTVHSKEGSISCLVGFMGLFRYFLPMIADTFLLKLRDHLQISLLILNEFKQNH